MKSKFVYKLLVLSKYLYILICISIPIVFIYGGGLGERILQGGANGAQIGGSIGAGIGLGVGIALGGIPAGPAMMVGGTISAAVGAAY